MPDILLLPIAILYLVIVSLLFLYGLYYFYLVILARRYDKKKQPTAKLTDWPFVTIQLPIFNERYVVARLIRASAQIDYPHERLEIQVLDDSTDETRILARQTVSELKQQGLNIVHLHRVDREGYKAGALRAGFDKAHGEYLAIFDADFVPPTDFLNKTLPHFGDPQVAFVQTRWGHLNQDFSFLTFMQSLTLDSHFIIEQFARSQAGYWFNFNGTAGIWRKSAIEAAGGWKADTLTEDLDLSYRAFLRGWKAKYLRDVIVPAELPVSYSAFRRQQNRWARGGFECARSLLPQIWHSTAPMNQKIQATFHLTRNSVYLLIFALTLLYPLVLGLSRQYPGLVGLFGIGLIFNLTAFAPATYFIVGQTMQQVPWVRNLPRILLTSILGTGLMVATSWAAVQVIFGKKPSFERTPKFGISRSNDTWTKKTYQLRLDRIVFFEIGFAVFLAMTSVMAFRAGNVVIALYSLLYLTGLSFNSGVTILHFFSSRSHILEASSAESPG